MSRSLIWETSALDELVDLAARNRQQAHRIVAALRRYVREDVGDVRKLSARDSEWRLRVGDWRVIFTLVGDGEVHVLAVLPRRDAYQ
jgi:mRNA-degrading endonuclease RelE of RelBE toxin-antitoxin system